MAYYAVLAAKGCFPEEWLDDFGSFDSPLGHHPDSGRVPGVEIASGSLGHGLPIAVGAALAGRRVYCLVGDGELDEGSNWEAIQYAGRDRPGAPDRGRRSTTRAQRTVGPAGSRRGSCSRAGRADGSTAATTTRSSAPSGPAARAGRTR